MTSTRSDLGSYCCYYCYLTQEGVPNDKMEFYFPLPQILVEQAKKHNDLFQCYTDPDSGTMEPRATRRNPIVVYYDDSESTHYYYVVVIDFAEVDVGGDDDDEDGFVSLIGLVAAGAAAAGVDDDAGYY